MPLNAAFIRKLTIPAELKEQYPVSAADREIIDTRVQAIRALFSKEGSLERTNDSRFVLVIGPCSADREDAVLDYMDRLARLQERVADKLFFIPRVYTTKPRTTGMGYKGLLHQPDPHAEADVFKGVIAVRQLHMRVIHETGFVCADEMLYPSYVKYIDDLLGYAAVGARSVENQEHRLSASAFDVPVGMKNPLSGNIESMVNAVIAASHAHEFMYRGWETHSYGNPFAHCVLRGYSDAQGNMHANCSSDDLLRLNECYQQKIAKGENLVPLAVVDVNHANSGRNPLVQIDNALDVLKSRAAHPEIAAMVRGLMIESYLEEGCQTEEGSAYGKSITDPCLGWENTERLVLQLADLL